MYDVYIAQMNSFIVDVSGMLLRANMYCIDNAALFICTDYTALQFMRNFLSYLLFIFCIFNRDPYRGVDLGYQGPCWSRVEVTALEQGAGCHMQYKSCLC